MTTGMQMCGRGFDYASGSITLPSFDKAHASGLDQ